MYVCMYVRVYACVRYVCTYVRETIYKLVQMGLFYDFSDLMEKMLFWYFTVFGLF